MKNTLLNKIEGVFVIVNTLLPAFIFLTLSLMFYTTWKNSEKALVEYSQSVKYIIKNAQMAKEEIQKAALEMGETATKIQATGKDITTEVTQMTITFNNAIGGFGAKFKKEVSGLNASIPLPLAKNLISLKPNTNVITVPIGSVLADPMEGIGNTIAEPFKPMSASFKKLGETVSELKQEVSGLAVQMQKLEKMEIYLDAVIVEYENILATVTEVAAAIGTLFKWILIGLAVLVVWFAFSYALWVRRRLITGMDLLRA